MSWRTVISAAQLATLALGALRSALHTGGTKYCSRALLCKWLFTLFNKLLYRGGGHVSAMLLHYELLQILCANDALASVFSKLILWMSVCRGVSAGQYISTKGLEHDYVNVMFGIKARQAAGQRRGYSDLLQAGRSGDQFPVASTFSVPVLTDPKAHNGYRDFPGVKRPASGADNLPHSITGVGNVLQLLQHLPSVTASACRGVILMKVTCQISQTKFDTKCSVIQGFCA